MTRFLGSVGQDPDAYGAITHAQQAYTTGLVGDALRHPERHADMGEAIRNAVHPGGEIAGMMSEARAHAVIDLKTHENSEYNEGVENNAKWTNRIIDLVGAKYLELLPVGGDVVTWIQEDITAAVVEKSHRDIPDDVALASGKGYTNAETAAKEAAASAVLAGGKAAGLAPAEYKDLQGSASTSTAGAHSIGRDLAQANRP